MTEENQDGEVNAGDDFLLKDTVFNSSGTEKDITGYDGQFTFARYRGAEPIIQYTLTDAEFNITNSSVGEVEVEIVSSVTEGIVSSEKEDFYYEIELTDTSGDDWTVTTGTITVNNSY